MPFVPVDNTAKVVLSGTLLGIEWSNQFYFEHPSAWTLTDLAQLATNMTNWWINQIKPLVTNQMYLLRVEATDLTQEFGLQNVTTPNANGDQTSEPVPNNVAARIDFYTGVRGRAFRGGNYMGGHLEANVNGNSFLAARTTAIIDAYGEIPLAITVTGVDHVVVTYNLNGVQLEEGITTDVLDYRCDGRVHSMRRRLR